MTLPFTEFKRRVKILNKVANELNSIKPDETNSSTNLSTTFTKYIQYTLPYKYITIKLEFTFAGRPDSLEVYGHTPIIKRELAIVGDPFLTTKQLNGLGKKVIQILRDLKRR